MTKRWWRRTAQTDATAQADATVQADSGGSGWEAGSGSYPVPPSLAAWAETVDVSRLSERTVREIEKYLRQYRTMTLSVSREMSFRLVAAVEHQVSPRPPEIANPLDVLATVLTVRRKQLGIG